MESYRKFWLENQDGQIWRFTEQESATFLESPQGLGMAVDYGGFRLGNAEVVNYQRNQLLDIQGVLMFYKKSRQDIYQQYFDFASFVSKNRLLKLHYQTPNSFDSYYCFCFVRQLQKSEIDNDRLVMQCPVVFKRQTLWRNDNANSVRVSNQLVAESKCYPLDRPYAYSASTLSNIRLFNRGNAEASLKIVIDGSVTNPMLKLYDNKGLNYGALKFVGSFDKVKIDSDDLNEMIELVKDGAVLTAPYSYQDLTVGNPQQTYVTFLKLMSGESTAVFTYDGSFDGSVTLEWRDEYVTV